jgi:hypothetical protein
MRLFISLSFSFHFAPFSLCHFEPYPLSFRVLYSCHFERSEKSYVARLKISPRFTRRNDKARGCHFEPYSLSFRAFYSCHFERSEKSSTARLKISPRFTRRNDKARGCHFEPYSLSFRAFYPLSFRVLYSCHFERSEKSYVARLKISPRFTRRNDRARGCHFEPYSLSFRAFYPLSFRAKREILRMAYQGFLSR